MRTRIIAAVVVLGLGIVGITLAQQPVRSRSRRLPTRRRFVPRW